MARIKHILLLLICGLSLDAAFAQEQEALKVTYIANEGVLISNGNEAVLIDALHTFYKPEYLHPDPSLLYQIINGQGPFTSIDYLLVTHVHRDHFDARKVAEFLSHHPETLLFSSGQVMDSIRLYSNTLGQHKDQPADSRGFHRTLSWNGSVKVEALVMRHGGNDHKWVQNSGYLVTLGGVKVLHVGDAELSERAMGKFNLSDENIDIAILPYWFMEDPEKVAELINPDFILLTHVSPDKAYTDTEEIKSRYGNVEIFTVSGQEFEY